MRGVVSAQTAAQSANKRSTACRKSAGSMDPVPERLVSAYSSFFSQREADYPFFLLNGPHKAKSEPLLWFVDAIMRCTAGVGTGLNENREANCQIGKGGGL